jgi:2-polyprenyl-6-methoxyphenol hydroxylase-like FAD-dependent oxidoreductase
LFTALRLHQTGVDVETYEQSGRIRELGVGLNLLPHAVKGLAEVGLLDRLDEVAIQTAELTYAHRLGQPILRRQCGLAAGFCRSSVLDPPPRRGRGAHGAAAGLLRPGRQRGARPPR